MKVVPGFGAGEVREDGIGFGAGYARVGSAPEQEGRRVDLGGVMLGVETIGSETVLYAAPKHQQIGHWETGDVHGFEAVVSCLAHVAVGAFQDVGAGTHA